MGDQPRDLPTATASDLYDVRVETSLVILGCSQRKSPASRVIPAIDRYDGPLFRVFRKRTREAPRNSIRAYILSGRFGLICGTVRISRYDRRISSADYAALRPRVEKQLKRILDNIQPERLFVSVGGEYWPLLEDTLTREVPPARLVVASGGIGGRASQLVNWLRPEAAEVGGIAPERAPGEAVLLGTTIRLGRADVLREARKALRAAPEASRRFETWYVAVGRERVAPKWLVSILFEKPVALFRTADARRVLSLLGVTCVYARRH